VSGFAICRIATLKGSRDFTDVAYQINGIEI